MIQRCCVLLVQTSRLHPSSQSWLSRLSGYQGPHLHTQTQVHKRTCCTVWLATATRGVGCGASTRAEATDAPTNEVSTDEAASGVPRRRRQPRPPEVRQKISEALKGRERSPQHALRIAQAHEGRKRSLGTRYAMHESATGRRHTLETRMKISRRMKDVHAQRKAAKMREQQDTGALARPAALATQQLLESGARKSSAPGLVMERAVQEMSQLRQEIALFMAQYEQEHGYKPQLQEAERSSPELYDKFVRYVAMQDYVRNFEAQL